MEQTRKKRICFVAVIALLGGLLAFFFIPHDLVGFDDPIESITVIVADNGKGSITQTTYTLERSTSEFAELLACLGDHSYHYSFGTLKSIISLYASNSSGMEGNNAGYWLHIYLDTASDRRDLTCGGTGEIMVDSIVYRMSLWGNQKQLAMMEEICAIVGFGEQEAP